MIVLPKSFPVQTIDEQAFGLRRIFGLVIKGAVVPIAIILEKIFFGIFIGGMVAVWKLLGALFSALEQSSDRSQAERETDKVFGKLNHDIEIYEPGKGDGDAD